ncbi:His-Xaa-Ser system protein HsxD [Enterobacter cloacae]|nr:His-Xaa-Ser system protein HsxD [Enterobacter cloacae]
MDNLKHGKNELGEYFLLLLNKTLYSREAIMKTCYAFTDDFFIHAVKSENEDVGICIYPKNGNDSNLLIVFYVQIMPDDFVMQLHRF